MNNRPADPVKKHVKEFCESIVPGVPPVVLVPQPPTGAAENECFPLVERAIGLHGGALVCGWAIWERPGVLIEAEFHGVWNGPNGLVDLSPLPPGIRHRVFVPDTARVYEGRQVNNIRTALKDDPKIRELIDAHDAYFEVMNRGDRAFQHDEIALSTDDDLSVVERLGRAEQALSPVSSAPPPGLNRAQQRAWKKQHR